MDNCGDLDRHLCPPMYSIETNTINNTMRAVTIHSKMVSRNECKGWGTWRKSVRNSHNFYASWNVGFPKWRKFWSTRTFGGSPTRPICEWGDKIWSCSNELVSAEMDWSYKWAWQVVIVKVELLVFWRVHLKVFLNISIAKIRQFKKKRRVWP